MSLAGWNKDNIIQLTIDKEKVGEVLTDFPVLVNLTVSGSGQNNYDCSSIFTELSYADRKKISIEYKGIQEHWVESIDDDFTGTDGAEVKDYLWTTSGDAIPYINNNKLRTTLNGETNQSITVASKYGLSGDFDVQISWTHVGADPTQTFYSVFYVINEDASNRFYLYYEFVGSSWQYRTLSYDGSYHTENTTVREDVSTKLRITRVGSTWSTYYWDGSGWVLHSESPNLTSTTNITQLKFNVNPTGSSGTPITIDWDDFKLNYGVIDWQGNQPIKEFRSYYEDRQQCYVEIENWDQANQEAQLWVKIPYVLPDQPTDLFLYYDSTQDANTTYIGDVGEVAAQNVWDTNFVAVYHMNQIPGSTDSIKDSTDTLNHGTPEGSMDSDDLVDGKIGKALDFDKSTADAINIGTPSFSGSFTVESIAKSKDTQWDGYGSIVSQRTVSSDNGDWLFSTTDASKSVILYMYHSGGTSARSVVPDDITIWNNYTGVYNENDLTIFLNGIPVGSPLSVTGDRTLSTSTAYIGRDGYSATRNTNVQIDETRISNIARSTEWLKATNYSNLDTLISFTTPKSHMYSGYVYQLGDPIQRTVYLYERNSGELMDKIVSNETGYYSLYTTSSGLHNVMCLDAEIEPNYDDLLISKIVPTEVL